MVVDAHLCPHALPLPSYIMESHHFLSIPNGLSVPSGAWLAAINGETIYSSIPQSKSISMVRTFLCESITIQWSYNQFILDVLVFILTHNIFVFNRAHYLQIQRAAMCTCCAPSYANMQKCIWGWKFIYSPVITSLLYIPMPFCFLSQVYRLCFHGLGH